MKEYLVIGNPINHSLSPELHNYWIRENGINGIYNKRKLNENDLKEFFLKIKNKEEFSCFEINDFLKQLTSKEMIIENYLSINEIVPVNILRINKKYHL